MTVKSGKNEIALTDTPAWTRVAPKRDTGDTAEAALDRQLHLPFVLIYERKSSQLNRTGHP